MRKQYEVTEAYSGNSKIERFIDGKSEGYTIRSNWEVSGYTSRLEEEGYTEGYNREEIAKKIMELEDDLKFWKEYYANILQKDAFLIGT